MKLKLSYSAINTYETCPLQYRYRYIERLPTEPKPALSFGKSLHEALRWFHSPPTPHPCSLSEFIEYLEYCWLSEGYSSAEEEAKYFYQAKSTLELYYRNNIESFRIPAALEQKFSIDMGDYNLTGVIDRVDIDEDGNFEVIDYKTNRRLPPVRSLESNLQLPIYHIACEQIWNTSPKKVAFYFILLNHMYSYIVTPELRKKALLQIETTLRGIENEEFSAKKNNLCLWCDYLTLCPAWSGNPVSARTPEAPPIEIGQAVDELVAAHREVKNKLSRIEGLKKIVASYLHEQKTSEVSGSRGIAYIDEDGCLGWEILPETKSTEEW